MDELRIVAVSGADGGIGREIARRLAAAGAERRPIRR
jgi:NAD(P)-dependent dehydrogenase (short-subunit alcohol dehydrogenase family)